MRLFGDQHVHLSVLNMATAHKAQLRPPSRTEGKPEHSYVVGAEAKSLTNNTSRRY